MATFLFEGGETLDFRVYGNIRGTHKHGKRPIAVQLKIQDINDLLTARTLQGDCLREQLYTLSKALMQVAPILTDPESFCNPEVPPRP